MVWAGVRFGGGRRANGKGQIGGNGSFCALWDQWNLGNPPVSLTVSLQTPTLSCPNAKCVSLNASGGTPPYSWTTNKVTTPGPGAFTLQITGAHNQNARFRPPVNNPLYGGMAYVIGGFAKNCGDTPNVCNGGQTTQSASGSPFEYYFGCNDNYQNYWWGYANVCTNSSGQGAYTVSMQRSIVTKARPHEL
jgi:hypothetical protein